MFSIKGTDITLTRGDTLYLDIVMTKRGEEYEPQEGDEIRFAMKRYYSDSDDKVILYKDIPIDTLRLEILPEDTKALPMGKEYVYDIQLTDADGNVDTFITGKIRIDMEVL